MDSLISSLDVALKGGSVMAFGMVFIGGVMTSCTPCVYPMIPITVSIIGGQKQSTRLRTFLLSLVYVLGIAFTYTVLGVVAVATGSLFGSVSANPWVLFAVANICILFGLSMLDVFALNIPLLNRLQASRPKGGSLLGVFALGVVFGLVASPCTAPVLGVLLAFVATTHSYVYGSSLMFTYAMGVGLLLVLVGTGAGLLQRMPKAGVWMERVKRVFGWLMLAMGEYFLIQMGKLMF
jgi:cytochrome c-type biogenesis protein